MTPEKYNEIVASVFEHAAQKLTEEIGRKPHIYEVINLVSNVFGQSCGVALQEGCSEIDIKRLQINAATVARTVQEQQPKGRLN